MPEPIELKAARAVLDFGARLGDGEAAHERAENQLKAAVAIHNILVREKVAYLADEVGMGKTYVALGALALLRSLNPDFRALVIAPRNNIQRKWAAELRKFVAHNYRVADFRVRNPDGSPARPLATCERLTEALGEALRNPDRDFFLRMPSFSLGMKGEALADAASAEKMENELRRHLPWLDPAIFRERRKDAFKENTANAICCGLPVFDLVIVDEAHNFKHGLDSGSSRNQVLHRVLGLAPDVDRRLFPGYGPRARMVLFLSATPVEDSFTHLWNQLNLLGHGEAHRVLTDGEDEEEKKRAARRFLIRRVTEMKVGGERLTKNLYRREWRSGGCETHDEPLIVKDPKSRLAVALVQKKVGEILGDEKFNRSFEIGMLASFESFAETSKTARQEAEADTALESPFDQADQAQEDHHRLGADVDVVKRIARSYRDRFEQTELPHPKMDALVERLAGSFRTGEKHLVFVRRVASVSELKRKLDHRYDRWLLSKLRSELPEAAKADFEALVRDYERERREYVETGAKDSGEAHDDPNPRGRDTFFAWFFRGRATRNKHTGAGLSLLLDRDTFFAENHVTWLLECRPEEAVEKLCEALGREREDLIRSIGQRASRCLGRSPKRVDRFEAVQAVAVDLLSQADGPWRDRARALRRLRLAEILTKEGRERAIHDADALIGEKTFFTQIRMHPDLHARLLPEAVPRPDGTPDEKAERIVQDHEFRWELLSRSARLGHALIDLYVLAVRHFGSLNFGESDEESTRFARLIEPYLERLAADMRTPPEDREWSGYDELEAGARNIDLIQDVNVPDEDGWVASKLAAQLGGLLSSQQPIAGMSGEVTARLVRQFRLPGYPLIMICTDVLREGEDLHTFCANVHHYGIGWMPSSMEQRIGRIDRVRSATERRLAKVQSAPAPAERKLQVYYPHLADTYELIQVREVLGRMDKFLRLMHEGIMVRPHESTQMQLDQAFALEGWRAPPRPYDKPLQSSFEVLPEHYRGKHPDFERLRQEGLRLTARLRSLTRAPLPGMELRFSEEQVGASLEGTSMLNAGDGIRRLSLAIDLWNQTPRLTATLEIRGIPNWRQLARLGIRARETSAEKGREGRWEVVHEALLGPDRQDPARLAWLVRRAWERAKLLEQALNDGEDFYPPRPELSGVTQKALRDLCEGSKSEVSGQGVLVPTIGGRTQLVKVEEGQGEYRLLSRAAGPDQAHVWESSHWNPWTDACLSLADLRLTKSGRLVAEGWVPLEGLDARCFQAQLESLALVADRLEFQLTGRDRR